MDRGTGQTSKQMKEAPPRALFIWCNSQLDYAQRLAARVGRPDLLIKTPDILANGAERLRGVRLSGIVADHALRLTEEQSDALKFATAYAVR